MDQLEREALRVVSSGPRQTHSVDASLTSTTAAVLRVWARVGSLYQGFRHALSSDLSVGMVLERALFESALLIRWLQLDRDHARMWLADSDQADVAHIDALVEHGVEWARAEVGSDQYRQTRAQVEAAAQLAKQRGFSWFKQDKWGWKFIPSVKQMMQELEMPATAYTLIYGFTSAWTHAKARSIEWHIDQDGVLAVKRGALADQLDIRFAALESFINAAIAVHEEIGDTGPIEDLRRVHREAFAYWRAETTAD